MRPISVTLLNNCLALFPDMFRANVAKIMIYSAHNNQPFTTILAQVHDEVRATNEQTAVEGEANERARVTEIENECENNIVLCIDAIIDVFY